MQRVVSMNTNTLCEWVKRKELRRSTQGTCEDGRLWHCHAAGSVWTGRICDENRNNGEGPWRGLTPRPAGDFALAYADQAERDHTALKVAVRAGKIAVHLE